MNTKHSMENFTVLTRAQCKDALVKYSEGICCGTSKPAIEGNIMNIVSYNSFRVSIYLFDFRLMFSFRIISEKENIKLFFLI